MTSIIKKALQDSVKQAMLSKDKPRLETLRMVMAAIKQREVDERIELNDEQIITLLDKLIKQRRESVKQYTDAGRQELADKESFEIELIQGFLPAQLMEEEIVNIIKQAIDSVGATSAKDMGKVVTAVKPQVIGRADMGLVSSLIKKFLEQ